MKRTERREENFRSMKDGCERRVVHGEIACQPRNQVTPQGSEAEGI